MGEAAQVIQDDAPAWVKAMHSAKPHFLRDSQKHGAVSWDEEAGYIRTAIEADEKLQQATPKSLVSAIRHIATVGISISPIHQFAFLQAQSVNLGSKGAPNWITEAKLKIGFKGHIQLLTSTGAVNWIRADVVREGDGFDYKGPLAMPTVSVPNPFDESRREVVGAYAIAELPSGTVYCEIMRKEELEEVEKASRANFGPWKTEFKSEMQKKAVINRLYKTVPKNPANLDRINTAQAVSGDADGFGFSPEDTHTRSRSYSTNERQEFEELIAADDALGLFAFSRSVTEQVMIDLYGTAPKGKKTEFKKNVSSLIAKGAEKAQDIGVNITELFEANDETAVLEIWEELTQNERSAISMTVECRQYCDQLGIA